VTKDVVSLLATDFIGLTEFLNPALRDSLETLVHFKLVRQLFNQSLRILTWVKETGFSGQIELEYPHGNIAHRRE
jgi:hypothetical protein